MSDELKDRIERLEWDLEVNRQLRGACSCGDSTILGVIHSDTKPCWLPTIHRALTSAEIREIWVQFADPIGQVDDLWGFARAVEKAHGIGGVHEI